MVALGYAEYHGSAGDVAPVLPEPLADDAYLERYFSLYGLQTWTDHGDSADVAGTSVTRTYAEYYGGTTALVATELLVLRDCKIYASSLLASRLAHRYAYSTLRNSPMMQEMWAVITLRTLCFRRGNPPPASLEFRYQEIMQREGLLDQISNYLFPLTDAQGNPLRPKNSNNPAHANLQVDRRYAESQIRVVSGSSDRTQSALGRRFDRYTEWET